MAYASAVLIAFAAIKIINLRLHLMFDTSESIEEQPRDIHRQRHKGNQANRYVLYILYLVYFCLPYVGQLIIIETSNLINDLTFFYSDFEDIELQVLNAKDSCCDSVSPTVPDICFHSETNQSPQGRPNPSVAEAVGGLSIAATVSSDQHCDVKVDVHRKSSSASSEPAIVAHDAQTEKTRQSVVKLKVLII